MPPTWLTVLAWCALGLAFASTVVILFDIYARGHRQRMRVMEIVWPVTALYFGPAAIAAYRAWGRPKSQRWQAEHGDPPDKPGYAATAVGVSHCGAGCTLGDIIAEFAIFALGATIAGTALAAEFVGDFVLAVLLGIGFQYFAIAPMRGLAVGKGIVEAAKADVLSLTAFQVGLFGWMALMYFVFFPAPHLHPNDPVYWFLMQIGMIAGFFTAWPVNVWLIRRGIKEAM
ncbi:DUF4396 domain-containing protein [Amycolatopsis taiwanensis]|uniref:Membrane protein n=1 Tax=Amycolatopsis taiwanensis TaxID=342230 RepID=A0A9W6VJ50_9PSEU|nr:DUF4396 domain-containing protein [Amycolatopsis taiwanensis]GLY68136.1 membrane protein [Amycolatopsis taiwanensis]